ncbi:MAG: 16S rRNA (adenine(1518)-N(6)/adenine(1519)-N(6))-dimethyltransferase RsmA [Alphaproteobacteria bacterium]|nr:16S rRNA (adenine(1518)-N(6)/adenine(1519)-N(6))-dimethyltransferase RsmA [Alphaproteobacteria bacterium]
MANLSETISSLPSLRVTVDAHNLMADKNLGQNFLLNQDITDKIIRLSLTHQQIDNFCNSHVIEIGPGPGGLTRAILKASPKKLTVIEMDKRCISIMEELQSKTGNILEIINNDALKFEYTTSSETPTHIISNLPYNISVPLLIKWLTSVNKYKSLTLMFQKEVAERILSSTHNKSYGRISIISQLQCKITKLFDLSPDCFVPAPKIWSSVLLFEPLSSHLTTEQISKLEKITSQAFSSRRKMIRQSLKGYPNLEKACNEIGIPLTSRPEEITPQQFYLLSEKM